MQQPIYWPDKLPSNPKTYQKAYDSLKLKSSQGNHPEADIDGIFGKGMHKYSLHQNLGSQIEPHQLLIRKLMCMPAYFLLHCYYCED